MNSKLDINTIVGFVLIAGILMYFGIFSPQESPAEEAVAAEVVDSTQVAETAESDPIIESKLVANDSTISDTANYLQAASLYGPFAQQMLQNEVVENYTLENDLLRLVISSKGAQVVEAELKNFKTYDSLDLYLIKNNADFAFPIQAGQQSSTSGFNFKLVDQSAEHVSLALVSDQGASLVYHYHLGADSYSVDLDIESKGMATLLANGGDYLRFEMRANRHEKNRDNELTRSEFLYRL